ncbi:MAG TPA: fatty acid desaturase family protein [Candidatus Binataceae bacterium]
MFQARSVFSQEELQMLKRKSDLRGAWMIFHAWAVVFLAMALFVKWPNPLTFLLAAAIIGARQLGLAVISHDAAHGLLFSNMRLNDFAGTWLTDYILLGDMYGYRPQHVAGHHRFTQQANDPDIALTKPFPITRASLRRKIIRDITGQTALKQRIGLLQRSLGIGTEMTLGARVRRAWPRLRGAVITHAVLFAILALAGYWWLYLVLWLVPFYTFQPMVVRIRAIAEHSMVRSNDDLFLNTRTTDTNWLTRAFIAPYFVNYHLEHHLLLAVPCYNLPAAHALLLVKGYGPRMEIQPGYRAMLKLAASKPESTTLRAAAA